MSQIMAELSIPLFLYLSDNGRKYFIDNNYLPNIYTVAGVSTAW